MKKLILVTGTFPFGKNETFIENEILFLSQTFDEIFIYDVLVNEDSSESFRKVPDNCSFFRGMSKNESSSHPKLFSFSILKQLPSFTGHGNFKGRLLTSGYDYRVITDASKRIETLFEQLNISKDDSFVIYSYWLSTIGEVALRIADYLAKKGIQAKKVARTHGFDLYSYRNELDYLPFQKDMIRRFDFIFPCSENGTNYLKEKYPSYANKIKTAYLGVSDRFNGKYPCLSKERFTIVSCSNIIPLKRVSMIAKALSLLSECQIRWIHFGDGELMDELKKEVAKLPSNIKAELPGRIPNAEIYDFYKNNNVNAFINVSTTEGLPVSVMEAFSFAIPAIATNVGGTSEIVEDGENGYLLDSNFEINNLAEKIKELYFMEEGLYSSMSIKARTTFENKFSAEKNYLKFASNLLEKQQ